MLERIGYQCLVQSTVKQFTLPISFYYFNISSQTQHLILPGIVVPISHPTPQAVAPPAFRLSKTTKCNCSNFCFKAVFGSVPQGQRLPTLSESNSWWIPFTLKQKDWGWVRMILKFGDSLFIRITASLWRRHCRNVYMFSSGFWNFKRFEALRRRTAKQVFTDIYKDSDVCISFKTSSECTMLGSASMLQLWIVAWSWIWGIGNHILLKQDGDASSVFHIVEILELNFDIWVPCLSWQWHNWLERE